MHSSSVGHMSNFVANYLQGKNGKVVDVGSRDVNGNYRGLFNAFDYVGVDIVSGLNVDVVLKANYVWPFEDDSIDCIVSGQAFEHIYSPEKVMKEIARTLKPGGYCCIIAPSAGGDHSNEDFKDYHRFSVDSMSKLASDIGFQIAQCSVDTGGTWKDCVLIARKPIENEKICLNLGCGMRKQKGFVNIDNRPEMAPDICFDVSEGLPYHDNQVDHILAIDFLEHIPIGKTVFVIEEIYRVLKPGGKLEHMTPSTDGRGAFQDPTHVSFWNINSWLYYMDDLHRDLYGIKAKFSGTNRDTKPSNGVIHTKGVLHAVK